MSARLQTSTQWLRPTQNLPLGGWCVFFSSFSEYSYREEFTFKIPKEVKNIFFLITLQYMRHRFPAPENIIHKGNTRVNEIIREIKYKHSNKWV